MKLKLLKDVFRVGQKGDDFTTRTDEQGQMYIDRGEAEQVKEDEVQEKKLVLLNPEPGTYTTAWVDAKTGKPIEEDQAEPKTMTTTGTVVPPADSVEETVAVETADPETAKTVTTPAKVAKKK